MLWKIVWRVLLGLLLTVYVAVALVNYSVVQSYLGTVAGNRLSQEWGGEVKIGALHAMPFDHLILNNVLLVSPTGDTILDVERLRCSFKRFPYHDQGIYLNRVYLRNGYYHLAITHDSVSDKQYTNLQYIFDHYPAKPKKDTPPPPFTVDVKALTGVNIHYKMDLPIDSSPWSVASGQSSVDIAHMDFMDIHLRAKDIHVVNDDVNVKLIRLSTTERSGFRAEKIAGNVHVGPNDITVTDFEAKTPQSRVLADVCINYNGWDGMSDYVNDVDHQIHLKEGTSVALEDAAYWAPVLWGFPAQIEGRGTVDGAINNMTADLMLHWGGQSGLLLTGHLQDITQPDSALVNVDIERLWTNVDDLAPLLSDGQRPLVSRKWESFIRQVDYIDIGGRVRGGLHQHSTVNLNMATGLGNISADAMLTPTPTGGMRFTAEANSNRMDLRLLKSEWISHSGFDLNMNGRCDDIRDLKTMHANLSAQLINAVVQGNHLSPIDLEGQLEGTKGHLGVISYDSLAQLSAQADFEYPDSVKILRGTVDIAHFDATAFKLLPEKYGTVVTTAALRLEGQDLDTMQGSLILLGTRLGALEVDRLKLTADANDGQKHLKLQSDPVDMTVDGTFAYDELPLILRQMGNEMLPAGFVEIAPLTAEESEALENSNLNLHLHWKDDGRFLNTLNDKIVVARDTRLTGNYNATERLKVVLRSDSVRFGSIRLGDLGVNGHKAGNDYVVTLRSQEVDMGVIELLHQADLTLKSNVAKSLMELAWGGRDAASGGDVALQLEQNRISVVKPDFTIGGMPWELLIDSLAVTGGEALHVTGEGITLRSEAQSVTAQLKLEQQPNDYINLQFDNFALTRLTDLLLQGSPVTLNGDIDGVLSVYGLDKTPYFNANLVIDSCVVNQQPLGDVRLKGNGNTELNTLNMELSSSQLAANGWIELGRQTPEMAFSVNFNSFELGLVAPMLSDFTSRFEGHLHGNFDIAGTTKKPVIVGEAYVEEGALQVDMTGVTYFFDDSVRFTNKYITLDGFRLRDPRNNMATVDGTIDYSDLDNVLLNLRMQTGNLLVLDRQEGDNFYGTVLASAEGRVQGPLEALQINVNARTRPGCSLTVPVNDQRQVKAQNYIHFVSDKPEATQRQTTLKKEQKLNLEVDLAITPDVQLNLPMDFSEAGVNVSAKGAGDLHLSMAGSNEPQLLGNYEIVSGTMKLSAISLISKDFTIEEGSSLNFPGNPADARFDLSAVYTQRVNLSTLTGGMPGMGGTQKYIQVEDVINIAGTLQEPTIGFDIRLPGADASVEEEVFAYIDRNSERDMLNQTVSLLAFGHFYNANSASGANGNLAASGSIGALSSLLSDMVSVVDIDVDYKMGNELTKDQLDVNISKDWGRWYLESTLGYGGESRELQSSDVNSAVIDALVGYRISPLVHLFAYNRTNTNDYTRMDLPYKQGVGLKLTKDFDNWGELFRKNKPKNKKGNSKQP